MAHLLTQYADCFIFDDSQLGCSTDFVEHKIEIGSVKLISLPPCRLPYKQREFVHQYMQELLEKGIIVSSNSEWASPIVLVPKADGTIRFCVDYIEVNKIIRRPDQYPMPHNNDLFDSIGVAIIFSKLDLSSGFWQIRMQPPHRRKTAFRTLAGLHEFAVIPFGLPNAPARFQRMMESVLQLLMFNCTVVLIGDVLIFHPSFDKHMDQDLPNMLSCLRKENFKAKIKKCDLCVPKVEYLGHMLGHCNIRPLQKKVKAISEMPNPKNVSEVRQLLGLVNYYRRYIPNLATITAPLNSLLRKDVSFEFDTKCEKAVHDIKTVLSSEPVMSLPDYVHYLHGTHFTIVADHQALKWLMKSKQTNPRLGRWAVELQAYNYDISYRKGCLNTNANCLSRLPIKDTTAIAIDFPSLAQLKRSQRADPEIGQIIRYQENGDEPMTQIYMDILKLKVAIIRC